MKIIDNIRRRKKWHNSIEGVILRFPFRISFTDELKKDKLDKMRNFELDKLIKSLSPMIFKSTLTEWIMVDYDRGIASEVRLTIIDNPVNKRGKFGKLKYILLGI